MLFTFFCDRRRWSTLFLHSVAKERKNQHRSSLNCSYIITLVFLYRVEVLNHLNSYPAYIGYAVVKEPDNYNRWEDDNSGQWSDNPEDLNAYRVDTKILQSGQKGRLAFKLDSMDATYINYEFKCQQWFEVF